MKITGQNVPPELQAAYDKLVSPAKKGQGDTGTIYTKRSVRANNPNSLAKGARTAIDRIIEGLARAYGRTAHTLANDYWRQQRTIELMDGQINPAYWIEAEVTSQDTFQVSGIGAEELPRPPYKYETPNNRPTNTTWQGVIDALGNPTYSGSLHGTLFRDDTWTYRRTVAILNEPIDDLAATAAFAYYSGEIKIDTDRRGSRAMCSLMSLVEVVETADQLTSPPRPPVAPSTSLYWRYKTPVATPPYYHIRQPRRVLQQVPRVAEKAHGSIMSVTLGTRPMAGHANNNNTTVTTEWIGTEKIYTVKPCGGAAALPVFTVRTQAGFDWHDFNPETGATRRIGEGLNPVLGISTTGKQRLVTMLDNSVRIYDHHPSQIATFEGGPTTWTNPPSFWPFAKALTFRRSDTNLIIRWFEEAEWNMDGRFRSHMYHEQLFGDDTLPPGWTQEALNAYGMPWVRAPSGYFALVNMVPTQWHNPIGENCGYIRHNPVYLSLASDYWPTENGIWYIQSEIFQGSAITYLAWPNDYTSSVQPLPLIPTVEYQPAGAIEYTVVDTSQPDYPQYRPKATAWGDRLWYQTTDGRAWLLDPLGNHTEAAPLDGAYAPVKLTSCPQASIGAIPR